MIQTISLQARTTIVTPVPWHGALFSTGCTMFGGNAGGEVLWESGST